MYSCIVLYVHVHTLRSKACLWKLVLSSHHMGFRDQIQIIELGSKHLYSLSLLDTWALHFYPESKYRSHLSEKKRSWQDDSQVKALTPNLRTKVRSMLEAHVVE